MDRHTAPMPAPAADRDPVLMFEAEALTPPPLYRSEGFAEDLLDGHDAAPTNGHRKRSPVAWLFAMPLAAAMVGALATTLVSLA